MGRAKLAMEYMKKDKARNLTFEKRKKGLKKKAYELATLCDVPVCVVIHQQGDCEADIYPQNHDKVRSIIGRYASEENNAKRMLNLQDVMDQGKKKKMKNNNNNMAAADQVVEEDLSYKLQNPRSTFLDGLGRDELTRMAWVLDYKLAAVENKIGELKDMNYFGGSGGGEGLGLDQWPTTTMDLQQMTSTGDAGVSSSSTGYDPNCMMMTTTHLGPNFYFGQVGSHALAAEASGAGGSDVASQPLYNGGTVFDHHQMKSEDPGQGLPMMWYDDGRFLS